MKEIERSNLSQLRRFVKRNIYGWHRILGLIAVVPAMMWSLSGIMHPFLAHWFKPTIEREFIKPTVIQKEQVQVPLKSVLEKNEFSSLKNFRLVSFAGHTYYQVKDTIGTLHYFNAKNGEYLPEGDKVYAEWMARYFLNDSISEVTSISLQTNFSQQYKYVNRLLPVWKVSFARADRMDVYVETSSSRLGTFNTQWRKVFLWVFDTFHNWSFLNAITDYTLRFSVMVFCLSMIMLSALTGLVIYGFMWKSFNNPELEKKRSGLQRYHRKIGIATSVFAFTFAFSGAYHASRKLEPNILPEMVYEPIVLTEQLADSVMKVNLDWERWQNTSVVKMGNSLLYQISYAATDNSSAKKIYRYIENGELLEDGDREYAKFLGNKFAGMMGATACVEESDCCDPVGKQQENECCISSETGLLKSDHVPKFESREYGFIFKRLPVIRIAYDTPDHTTYYIETATSRLAACINDVDRSEGYSFAVLHKFLFMDWAGKNIRDLSILLAALSVFLVNLLGLILFIKK